MCLLIHLDDMCSLYMPFPINLAGNNDKMIAVSFLGFFMHGYNMTESIAPCVEKLGGKIKLDSSTDMCIRNTASFTSP